MGDGFGVRQGLTRCQGYRQDGHYSMNRILYFLFTTTGIVGVVLLMVSVPVGNETLVKAGLISILSSALLLVVVVIVGSMNRRCRCHRQSYRKTLPH